MLKKLEEHVFLKITIPQTKLVLLQTPVTEANETILTKSAKIGLKTCLLFLSSTFHDLITRMT